MADTDDTQEPTKKGGGVTGVVAGAGVGYLGGATIAKIARKDFSAEKIAEQGKVTAAEKAIVDGSPELTALKGKIDGAKAEHVAATVAHEPTLHTEWWKQMDAAKPEEMAKLRQSHLDGQLANIEKSTASPEAKEFAATFVKEKKAAVAAATGSEGFNNLSPEEAKGRIEAEIAKLHTKPREISGVLEGMDVEAASVRSPEALKHLETAHPEVATKVTEAVKETPTAKAVEAAKGEVTAAETAFKPKFDTAKAASTAYKDAEKNAAKFAKLEASNVEKGFFKRPMKMAAGGTGLQKLAVIGGSVALAAATYMGVKAFRNRDKKPDSYVEQVTQTTTDTSAVPAR